jgi:hypothetical protein
MISIYSNLHDDKTLVLAWYMVEQSIAVVARPKAWTLFSRSNTGVVGSNPTQGIDICVRLFCVCVVLCVGSGLATGWSPARGVLPSVYRITKLKKAAKVQQRAVEPQIWQSIRFSIFSLLIVSGWKECTDGTAQAVTYFRCRTVTTLSAGIHLDTIIIDIYNI